MSNRLASFADLPCPYVIAEIGGNHEGDFSYACKLLDDAAEAGAHSVKFQAYAPDCIVNRVVDPERNQHFKRFALQAEQYVMLATRCHERGVGFMASLWDSDYIELLDPYIQVHKVGSGDLTNFQLIRELVCRGKPLCIGTAMSTLEEIYEVIAFIDQTDPGFRPCKRLCLMHCVALYGNAKDEYANLRAIETMRSKLPANIVLGYSDHTVGTVALEVAVGMGARVIEKHFTDDPSRSFRDHHISVRKEDLAAFVEYCRRRECMLGGGIKEPVAEVETPERIREFRRAIYFSKDCTAGTVADDTNLTTLRPNVGIDAKEYFAVIGKRLKTRKKAFEPLSWSDFQADA